MSTVPKFFFPPQQKNVNRIDLQCSINGMPKKKECISLPVKSSLSRCNSLVRCQCVCVQLQYHALCWCTCTLTQYLLKVSICTCDNMRRFYHITWAGCLLKRIPYQRMWQHENLESFRLPLFHQTSHGITIPSARWFRTSKNEKHSRERERDRRREKNGCRKL